MPTVRKSSHRKINGKASDGMGLLPGKRYHLLIHQEENSSKRKAHLPWLIPERSSAVPAGSQCLLSPSAVLWGKEDSQKPSFLQTCNWLWDHYQKDPPSFSPRALQHLVNRDLLCNRDWRQQHPSVEGRFFRSSRKFPYTKMTADLKVNLPTLWVIQEIIKELTMAPKSLWEKDSMDRIK